VRFHSPWLASNEKKACGLTLLFAQDELVLNGKKWWISGALDPRCSVIIFMGRTAGDLSSVPAHRRHR
jgi:hypothetical protein